MTLHCLFELYGVVPALVVQGDAGEHDQGKADLELTQFDAAPLIAFIATRGMNYAQYSRVMQSMIPRVGLKQTDEFHQDTVRSGQTSGLTRKQVADDLGTDGGTAAQSAGDQGSGGGYGSVFDKWVKAGGQHHRTATRLDPIPSTRPDEAERKEANKAIECINCFVCYASCDTVASNLDYLGPAALQRAWALYNDTKDADKQAILDRVSGNGGCHNCHSQGSCTLYCPNELDPMNAIAGLKRAGSLSFLKKGI